MLRPSAERGDKTVLFVDQALFYLNQESLYLRVKDLELDKAFLEAFNKSEFTEAEIVLLHHAPEIARSYQTHTQLVEITEEIKTKLKKVLDVFYCIHCDESEGNAALCISCSCHPKKGGMFLEAAVKHELSLSKSFYLCADKKYAHVAKKFGISILEKNKL